VLSGGGCGFARARPTFNSDHDFPAFDIDQSSHGDFMTSRRKVSIPSEKIEEVAHLVHEVVTSYRTTGLKNEHAQSEASRDLGLTERRVRAYVYGEVFSVCRAEADRIRAGFVTHLDREAARLIARAEQVRQRRLALTPEAHVAPVTVTRLRNVK